MGLIKSYSGHWVSFSKVTLTMAMPCLNACNIQSITTSVITDEGIRVDSLKNIFFSVIHVQTAESSLCQYPISFPSAKIKKQTNKKTTDLIIWLVLAIWAFPNALFFAGLKIKKVFQFVSGAPNDCIYTT